MQKKLHWSIYSAPDSAKKTTTTTIYIWTDSAKKKKNNLHMDRQCKKTTNNYIWTDSAKKTTTNNLHMDRQCKKKKLHWSITVLQTVQKTNKKKTTIYIWTVHIYRLYRRQCAKYTYIYSVHIVYYKDTLNYQRHIIHPLHIIHTLYTLDTSMHHRIKLEHNPQSMQSVLLVFSSLSSSFAKHRHTHASRVLVLSLPT